MPPCEAWNKRYADLGRVKHLAITIAEGGGIEMPGVQSTQASSEGGICTMSLETAGGGAISTMSLETAGGGDVPHIADAHTGMLFETQHTGGTARVGVAPEPDTTPTPATGAPSGPDAAPEPGTAT